jgi:hypothetical protein
MNASSGMSVRSLLKELEALERQEQSEKRTYVSEGEAIVQLGESRS